MVKERRQVKRGIAIVLLAVVGLIAVVLILLPMNQKETYIDGGVHQEKVVALFCSARGKEEAFFASDTVNTIENKIKVTFSDSELEKLFYAYEGVYRSNDLAVSDETRLHAKYNIYMGEHGRLLNDLAPSYSIVGNKLQITLYVDKVEKIDTVTAGFFFVDKDEISNFKRLSVIEVENFYENKGFSCDIF